LAQPQMATLLCCCKTIWSVKIDAGLTIADVMMLKVRFKSIVNFSFILL